MINTSKTTEMRYYEDYKPSNVEWIEKIPAHWEMRRVKTLFSERVEKGYPEEPLLAATQTKGVVTKAEYGKRTVVAQKDLHLLKLVKVGDFVISLRSFEGGIEYSYAQGIISPAYTILKLTTQANKKYFKYFLKSSPFISSLSLFVTGIREGQNIEYPRLSRSYFPFPPLEEQEAIVRYLDHTTLKIDRAVRSKKKLIAALNEQKQAIITQAVTHGVNQNVQMKDSGVKWLGEIPAHWEMRRLRQIASMRVSNVDKHSVKGQPAVRLCNYVDVYKNDVIKNDMSFMEATASKDEVKSFKLCKNDVVITKDSEDWKDIGVPAFVESTADDLVCGYHLAILRPNLKIVEGAYLFRMLLTPLAKTQFGVNANGITRYGLTQNGIKGINLCLPPLDEQREIVAFLDRETAAIDKTIELTKKEIALLQEYKTRLIADAVTGAIDVRELAKDLPDIEMEAVLDDTEVDEMDDVEEEMEE